MGRRECIGCHSYYRARENRPKFRHSLYCPSCNDKYDVREQGGEEVSQLSSIDDSLTIVRAIERLTRYTRKAAEDVETMREMAENARSTWILLGRTVVSYGILVGMLILARAMGLL
jgi:hypothetical protein